MAMTRLDSDERRKAIVRTAVPLFARKGFAGTTTRELAESAGISEALLFRHFPSKQMLYREILQEAGCQGDPALEKLATLPPSSATLVCMVRFMVQRFVLATDCERADLDTRLRLILYSFLEDGVYARELFDAVFERVLPFFTKSFEVAVAVGDVVPPPGATANRFWLAHHIAALMAFAALPGQSCVHYEGGIDSLVEEASHFILRGIGMTDAVIAALAEPGLRAAAD